MTFGRPAAIPDSYVRTALPCHPENDSLDLHVQNQDSLYFFNATMQVHPHKEMN
jgi:hypothetical protein